ncbi:hypothetical protein [Pontibacillus salipaludis]|uniref:MFS transporter n=1 Tax=Pontibacillus salipaludis TaxID=1697394 RepID=A0ABQ1Q456_9BACI|nr:hypothetical protein [Pontibacillus salipaludis]GGD13025.1 hypothetical protein GCM10011389_20770 [Pontibacillus salipaludis]
MRKTSDLDPTIVKVAIIVVGVICAGLLPLILVTILQDIFYFSRDHIYFEAPLSAYIWGGAAILSIPMLLVVDLIAGKWNDRWGKKALGILMTIGVVVFSLSMLLSVRSYFYFDPNGLHVNGAWTLDEHNIDWDHVEEVVKKNEKKNGTLSLKEVDFVTKNGDVFTITNNKNWMDYQYTIYDYLEKADVTITEKRIEAKS